MQLTKFTSSYGDGKSVTYYRPVEANDQEALKKADELNIDNAEAIAAYQAACATGLAGAVATEIETVDA